MPYEKQVNICAHYIMYRPDFCCQRVPVVAHLLTVGPLPADRFCGKDQEKALPPLRAVGCLWHPLLLREHSRPSKTCEGGHRRAMIRFPCATAVLCRRRALMASKCNNCWKSGPPFLGELASTRTCAALDTPPTASTKGLSYGIIGFRANSNIVLRLCVAVLISEPVVLAGTELRTPTTPPKHQPPGT